jgi:hypothetical protein
MYRGLAKNACDSEGLRQEALAAAYRQDRGRVTLLCLQRVGLLALVPIAVAIPINLLAFSDHLTTRLLSLMIEANLCLVAWALSRRTGTARQAIPLTVTFVVAVLAVALWSLSFSPHDLDVLVGAVAAAMMTTALVFPWGAGPQVAVSVAAAVGFMWLIPWSPFDLSRSANILIVLGLGVCFSSVGAFLLDGPAAAGGLHRT